MGISLNDFKLMGYLTRDPETYYSQNGTQRTVFTVAVNSYSRDGEEATEYIPVTTFENIAASCHRYLRKGSPVFVEARFHNNTYTQEDGSRRSFLQVIARRVQFLSSRGEQKTGDGSSQGFSAYKTPASQDEGARPKSYRRSKPPAELFDGPGIETLYVSPNGTQKTAREEPPAPLEGADIPF